MEFIKGADISFLEEMMDLGAVFYDENGTKREVFSLLKENGVNSIRLRIWNQPENVPESGGYCSLSKTIAMAKTIKEHGMSFMLDFHYSDWWADPQKQTKPKAWQGLSYHELIDAVYQYTKEVLLALEQAGASPDYVQIGNEIRSGMLFPDGEVPNFPGLVPLINAGIHAVREVGGKYDTKVVIHLDQGGRFFYLKEWFDQAMDNGLQEFDIIAISYYPFWHGTFSEFRSSMDRLADTYHKPVIVAETAYAWRLSPSGFIGEQQERIAGFTANPEGQKTVLDLVMNITASVKDGMGLGVYYWEPVVSPAVGKGGWCESMGVFGADQRALPALRSFRFEREMFIRDKVARICRDERYIIEAGTKSRLPEQLAVLLWDGTLEYETVVWQEPNSWKPVSNTAEYKEGLHAKGGLSGDIRPGCYEITGRLFNRNMEVKVLAEVREADDSFNFLRNPGFEAGMDGWEMDGDETVTCEVRPDFVEEFPAPPIHYVLVESQKNFQCELRQKISQLPAGTYRLSCEYTGTNTTGVDVRLFARTPAFVKDYAVFPTDGQWVEYEIKEILMEAEGDLEVGVRILAPPIYGKIRNLKLNRMHGETTNGERLI